jgi:RNA polymerase sigma factor (TIGR02999 family)
MVAAREVTKILADMRNGRRDAWERLLPIVYTELRQIASHSLRNERKDHTLQATALVHEAYLRLVGQKQVHWRDRAHFIAAASQTIRRVLVDHARSRLRRKRSGRLARIQLDDTVAVLPVRDIDLVALDEAMARLAERSPRQASVVEMRFFGGASVEETAEVFGVSTRSIERDWKFARAWLFREISKGDRTPHG